MTFRIAIAGKGGVGKSTIAALTVRALHELKGEIIMAVDADPNSNLGEKLGVKVERTIGDLREDIIKNMDEVPVGQSKQEYVRYQMQLALVEGEHFDLLTMGRQEGPGCYCYINNILRTFLDMAMDDYDYVVIDNEAGMEHLSRRTTKEMDVMLIVADPTRAGLETAVRIKELASNMGIEIGQAIIVINRVRDDIDGEGEKIVQRGRFDLTYALPFDAQIEQIAIEGQSLLELDAMNPFYQNVKRMIGSVVR